MDLKMRVFVVNSEDAKAVGDYIKGHEDQVPAAFVVLAHHLSMAVLYDPNALDLSDASVADRLRKQVAIQQLHAHQHACMQIGVRQLVCGLLVLAGSCLRRQHQQATTGGAAPLAPALLASCTKPNLFAPASWQVDTWTCVTRSLVLHVCYTLP
jgi:hypothetical protein